MPFQTQLTQPILCFVSISAAITINFVLFLRNTRGEDDRFLSIIIKIGRYEWRYSGNRCFSNTGN